MNASLKCIVGNGFLFFAKFVAGEIDYLVRKNRKFSALYLVVVPVRALI